MTSHRTIAWNGPIVFSLMRDTAYKGTFNICVSFKLVLLCHSTDGSHIRYRGKSHKKLPRDIPWEIYHNIYGKTYGTPYAMAKAVAERW